MNLAPGLPCRFPQSPGSRGNSFKLAEVSEVTFPVIIILNFYVLDKETKQKVQGHKEKTSFPLSTSRHREIDKTMRDAKDTAAKKGLGRNIDATFMRPVRRAGCVESFSIKTQRQWEQELPKLIDPDCILWVRVTALTH